MFARTMTSLLMTAAVTAGASADGRMSDAHRATAERLIESGIAYLKSQQDEKTGGWSVPENGPVMPAITGLAISAIAGHPEIDHTDPHVARGLAFIESFIQPDGGIYDRVLPAYNTSISLSALARAGKPTSGDAIRSATKYLLSLQWSEDSVAKDGQPAGVTEDHPFYGGVGYGKHGRPDGSNLHFFLQALEDAGVEPESEGVQRALVYLERLQMDDSINDMAYADGSTQGGFIYATSENRDTVGLGESKAGTITETLDDGTNVSRLRAYGSMTYAGFKSFAFADLDRDDPRVTAAREWIAQNYTLKENPGVGDQGRYYYYLTFGKALAAWGDETIEIAETKGSAPKDVKWAEDLVDQLATMQNPDGSFKSVHARWMEDNPVLITSYALIALHHAVGWE